MSIKEVWFITGAGRGMGVDFAKAALAAGHAVVATGRDAGRVSKALGQSNDLLAVRLDITSRADALAAVRVAIGRFGRIDVLVNNAASLYAGYFEELTPEQMDLQLTTSLIGPMKVTRGTAGDAQAALGPHHHYLLFGGLLGLRVRRRVRGVEVRYRRLDGLVARGTSALRHHHHHRQPRLLSYRTAHRAIDELRPLDHQGLRRAESGAARVLEDAERKAIRGPGQARSSASSPSPLSSHRPVDSSPAPTPSAQRSRRSPT